MTDSVTFDDAAVELARELASIRHEKKLLDDREKEVRAALLEKLHFAVADTGLTASGEKVVHIETQNRTTINRKRLEALHPDVFEDVKELTTIEVLKIDVPAQPTI